MVAVCSMAGGENKTVELFRSVARSMPDGEREKNSSPVMIVAELLLLGLMGR